MEVCLPNWKYTFVQNIDTRHEWIHINYWYFFCKTRIIRSNSGERIWYGPDNPCRAKKNTTNFFIGNFTILTQLCDFFCFALPFFLNTNNFFIDNFTILTQLCDFFVVFFTFFLNERFNDVMLDRAWQMTNSW